ncbi:ATP-grasp domain-containing protein [Actinomadura fulvescens]|uniref:ATP-grasp domain-containing protein n=1 Tax=Actinomadura fulvescens TaxID=46160 RepID=A0ABN3PUP8_9ACTN
MPRYLVINRFDDEFGEYHRFVPAKDHRLAYITLQHGLPILDTDGALDTVVVDDLTFETVLPVARRLTADLGPFDGVVGISERDVLTAARLRTALGIAGWTPEFVSAFRDKPRMKEIVGAAGLPVPRFQAVGEDTTAERVVADLGLPVILKPRDGAGSKGVVLARSVAGLAEALADARSSPAGPDGYECEEYVAGDIYHVDGIRRGGLFHFVSASVYVNTCLDFMDGMPLGSLLLDEGDGTRDRLIAFASRCLDALGLRDGPFHLEVFGRPDGELVFLEIGLRPGGAEVAFIHRDLFGIDLFGEAFRATLGLPPLTPREAFRPAAAGGWVSVPEPRPLPSRALSRTSMLGVVPEVYAEVIPDVGAVFDGTGGYDHIGGRFRLRGPDHATVRRGVLEVMARYELIAEPIGRAGCATWSRVPAHGPKGD